MLRPRPSIDTAGPQLCISAPQRSSARDVATGRETCSRREPDAGQDPDARDRDRRRHFGQASPSAMQPTRPAVTLTHGR